MADKTINESIVLPGPSGKERGFSLTELMIAMFVFTLVIGSVVLLLTKSQMIFRTEQGVSEMDQNARLVIDFLTRDIQQSKENALGLGPGFRSIYSYNGPEGKTDEITIISSDTETRIPADALPLIPASNKSFSTSQRYVEVLPNGAGHLAPSAVVDTIQHDEEFVISTVLHDGAVQFDFVRVRDAKLTGEGVVGISFEPVEHRGIEPGVPFGSHYEGGGFTMRPITIKRYFIDKANKEHPRLALSINDGDPMPIARNVVAFQLRYLQVKDGEVEGQWVREQEISKELTTRAIEITMTARTEIAEDPGAERLVTLASVVRPRELPGDAFGGAGGPSSPGTPGESVTGDGSGDTDGDGIPDGDGPGNRGRGFANHPGSGSGGDDNGSGSGGFQGGGYRYGSRQVGNAPKLGRRINPR